MVMKAVLVHKAGGPEQLYVGEVSRPVPGEGQVLIRVMATSVNGADLVQRAGRYPAPLGESEILGLEAAGVIAVLGPGVSGWQVGDAVMSLVAGGGYAEYALAWAEHLLPKPENFSFLEAACIAEVYLTAYLNLFLLGELRDGECVLVHGGGGGVNTAAIQLCQELVPDARLMVTASPKKVGRVRKLGVHHVVNYREVEFAEAAKEFTQRRGLDLILDHIGADYLDANMRALGVGGRLVVIGISSGPRAELNMGRMMVKRQRIIGSVLRSRSVAEKAELIASFCAAVMPALEAGRIVPRIHAVFPLELAGEAHRAMAAGAHFGKLVLKVVSDHVE